MNGLRIEMRSVLIAAEKVWKELGREEGVTITSALDSTHSAGSLHYYGFAVDLRTRYFENDEAVEAYSRLFDLLDKRYDIVLHNTHIHVEYDYKGD